MPGLLFWDIVPPPSFHCKCLEYTVPVQLANVSCLHTFVATLNCHRTVTSLEWRLLSTFSPCREHIRTTSYVFQLTEAFAPATRNFPDRKPSCTDVHVVLKRCVCAFTGSNTRLPVTGVLRHAFRTGRFIAQATVRAPCVIHSHFCAQYLQFTSSMIVGAVLKNVLNGHMSFFQ